MNAATRRRVLIVDDDIEFVESNRDLLEAEGYEVLAAHDGASGLELARKSSPDLMILDVMMASLSDGFEVSRKIPTIPELRNMPVLLVTGVTQALGLPYEFSPDETWLPVDTVLNKPVPPAELLAKVRERIG